MFLQTIERTRCGHKSPLHICGVPKYFQAHPWLKKVKHFREIFLFSSISVHNPLYYDFIHGKTWFP